MCASRTRRARAQSSWGQVDSHHNRLARCNEYLPLLRLETEALDAKLVAAGHQVERKRSAALVHSVQKNLAPEHLSVAHGDDVHAAALERRRLFSRVGNFRHCEPRVGWRLE